MFHSTQSLISHNIKTSRHTKVGCTFVMVKSSIGQSGCIIHTALLFMLLLLFLLMSFIGPYVSEPDQTIPGQGHFGVERERSIRAGCSGRVFWVTAIERVPSSNTGLSASSWLVGETQNLFKYNCFSENCANMKQHFKMLCKRESNNVSIKDMPVKHDKKKKKISLHFIHSQNKQPKARLPCSWWLVGRSSSKGTNSVSSTRTFF